jgi:hypothetical protein
MAIPVSQFRNRISRHVPGCPIPVIDKMVIEAAVQFCEDTLLLSKAFEIQDVLYTAINTGDNDSVVLNIYSWDDTGDVAIDDVGGAVFDEDYAAFDPIVVTELKINQSPYPCSKREFENDVTDIQTDGYKFFNFPTQFQIKLFPLNEFYDSQKDFDVFLRIAVKPTLTCTVIEDALYNNYREAIAAHALSVLHSMPQRSWTDLAQAEIEIARYQHEMGRARIRMEKGFTDSDTIVAGGYF